MWDRQLNVLLLYSKVMHLIKRDNCLYSRRRCSRFCPIPRLCIECFRFCDTLVILKKIFLASWKYRLIIKLLFIIGVTFLSFLTGLFFKSMIIRRLKSDRKVKFCNHIWLLQSVLAQAHLQLQIYIHVFDWQTLSKCPSSMPSYIPI